MSRVAWEAVPTVRRGDARVTVAAPTLAAVGEAVAGRAGMLDLRIEEMMLGGVFSGVDVAVRTGGVTAALLAGGLAGFATGMRTLDEARDNLKDAVGMVIEGNRELAQRDTAGRRVIREALLVGA